MHYTSGTTGTAQGRDDGLVGRGHGPTGLRGRGRRLALRPRRTCTWSARRCTTPSRSDSPAARSWRAGRWPSSAASMPRPPSIPSGATGPRRPSSSRRTCSAYCRAPTSAPTRRSTRCASSPTPGRPVPETVKRAVMERVRPGGVWEFYGSTEAQFTVCPPEDWLEHPGTVGRARPGRRLHIAPVADADMADAPTSTPPPPIPAPPTPVGTIWCDMPRLRPLQLLGEPRGHRRRLERVGVHRRRPRPARCRRLPLPDRPAPRPHHQRGRQRLSRRGRERPGRRRGHRRGGRLRPRPTSSGASGSAPPTSPTAGAVCRPRRPCGPPRRPVSPRTSGPSRISPPATCPTRPPASSCGGPSPSTWDSAGSTDRPD